MKTLLISPPLYIPTDFHSRKKLVRIVKSESAPSLGIFYLAGMLEKQELDVNVIDMFDMSFEDTEVIIRKEKPDIVGITSLTDTRFSALTVAKLIKKIDRKIITVLGGSHPTFFPEQMLRHYPEIDYIVLGEGEYTFLELVKAIYEKKGVRNISGIAFRENDSTVITSPRERVKNLDEIPFPAHHFIQWERYTPSGVDLQDWKTNNRKYGAISTSRGCPYNCTYCSVIAFWGRQYRCRTPQNVVNEIEILYKQFGVDLIGFNDDIFTLRMDRVIEICKEIVKRKIKIQWTCATRVNFVSKEMLIWMKRSGCSGIYFGVESGSEKILKNIRKNTSIEQILNAFKLCKEVDIPTGMGIMIGNPGENNETVRETIRLMDKINPVGGPGLNILMVYPNTEVYELAKKKGFIDDNYWLTNKAAPFYTAENPLWVLENFQLKIYLSYYWKKRDFFQIILKLFERFTVTDNLLDLLFRIKNLLKIKSFGIYKLLKFTKKNGS